MSGFNLARCVIPKFAQAFVRSNAFTTPVITQRFSHRICKRAISSTIPKQKKETITVTFECEDGSNITTQAKVGDNMLDVVIDNDIDLDGFGACEGTLACSTCHLIFKQEDYDKLPSEPSDEELDMLDLAYGLTDTSRLGCQIILTKDMEGLVVKVPSGVADAREPS